MRASPNTVTDPTMQNSLVIKKQQVAALQLKSELRFLTFKHASKLE